MDARPTHLGLDQVRLCDEVGKVQHDLQPRLDGVDLGRGGRSADGENNLPGLELGGEGALDGSRGRLVRDLIMIRSLARSSEEEGLRTRRYLRMSAAVGLASSSATPTLGVLRTASLISECSV